MRAAELASSERATHARHELTDVRRKIDGILDAIERGAWSPSLQHRLDELERQRGAGVRAPAADQAVVHLHPATSALYRQKVQCLVASLSDPEIKGAAAEVIRGLIERVVLVPDPAAPDGHRLEVHGAAATVLALGQGASSGPVSLRGGATRSRSDVVLSQVSVVAGTGFEPVTFRL